MRTSAFCPISNKKINEKVARLNAGYTILVLLIFALTQHIIPILFLAVDFFIRGSDQAIYSPIRYLAKYTADSFGFKPQFVNEGPKKFTARIGFVFTILISIAYFFDFLLAANNIAAVLGFFAFLEGVFGFCVACQIYPFFYKVFYKDSFTVSI